MRSLCGPILLASFLPLLLIGCDEQAADEYWYSGTQIAVEACIKRNVLTLVDKVEIKARCIRKHHHEINPDVITGKLAPDFDNPDGLNLSPELHNNSNDQIITGAVITFTVNRKGSPDLVVRGIIHDLWILPNDVAEGYAGHASDSDDALWKEAQTLLKDGAKWSWTISQAAAVGFRLRT